MSKYLIFRTDKIGDFLLTAILIKSIKRNDPKSKIIVIIDFNMIKIVVNPEVSDADFN